LPRPEFLNLEALNALKNALGARGSSKIAVGPTLNSSAQFSPRVDRECFKTADFRFLPLSSVRGLRYSAFICAKRTNYCKILLAISHSHVYLVRGEVARVVLPQVVGIAASSSRRGSRGWSSSIRVWYGRNKNLDVYNNTEKLNLDSWLFS